MATLVQRQRPVLQQLPAEQSCDGRRQANAVSATRECMLHAMPLVAGDRVDRFVVEELIGEGAMGHVYRAFDERLHRFVALKVLRPEARGDSAGAARVLREARAVAALNHPNIVAVFDADETGDPPTPFIAMELVEGRPLRALVGDERFTTAARLRCVADIARALAAAHAAGLVHRDVKPENVMLRPDGTTKVLDFGVAKRGTATTASTSAVTLDAVEQSGVVGTPYYMAPEQLGGAAADARTDQFAWGVTAYELLARAAPWGPPERVADVLNAIVSRDPRCRRPRGPRRGAAVARVIARAMAKDRDTRFADMGEVLAALETPAPPRGRYAVLAALGAAALFAVAFGALRAARAPGAASVSPAAPHCARNADCPGGVCHTATGACAKLASEDCEVLADPAALTRDDTVYVGVMFPRNQDFGLSDARGAELARRDFASVMASAADPRARPFAIVSCDDSVDPRRAATHLVDDVGVPAVIGFGRSAELIDLASSIFIPRGVLAITSENTSPLVTRVPQRPGQPKLVFRTTYTTASAVDAVSAYVVDVLEPALRREGRHAPLRIAALHERNVTGDGFANSLFRTLRFNGKTALENGGDYLELALPDTSAGDATPGEIDAVAAMLARQRPDLIVFPGVDAATERVVEETERTWGAAARLRYMDSYVPDDWLVAFFGQTADRRRRFRALTTASDTVTNARFVAHYNDTFDDVATRTISSNSTYDAFYVIAYATYALGGAAPSGEGLSRAIERLLPPGRKIEVGAAEIFDAFDALAAGGRIDLQGATGPLDFDVSTGEAPNDEAILCIQATDGGAPKVVESGLHYDSTTRRLVGREGCDER